MLQWLFVHPVGWFFVVIAAWCLLLVAVANDLTLKRAQKHSHDAGDKVDGEDVD